MLTLLKHRPLVAGTVLVAITLASSSLGLAGWARWQDSRARPHVQG
jgi:hypothetical protein